MNSKVEVRPDWGHALETPDGRVIRLPLWAFPKLRQLGLLEKNRAKLLDATWLFLNRKFDPLMEGLRNVLGPDLSGPAWLVCKCTECQRGRSDVDDTPLPRGAFSRAKADQVVREVKAKRKAA